MDLKSIRNVHLYLGCFFAPLLMAFVLSGVLQTFHLHEERKDGYQPLAPVKALAEVHMHQRFSVYDQEPSTSFRFLVLLMSLGLLTTTGLGVFMALGLPSHGKLW